MHCLYPLSSRVFENCALKIQKNVTCTWNWIQKCSGWAVRREKPLPRGGEFLPRGRCSPAMGGSPGNLGNHLHQNYIKLSPTKDSIYNYHDFKLYLSIAKTSCRPECCEVWETNMGTIWIKYHMNAFDVDFHSRNINCQLHWLGWKWTCT